MSRVELKENGVLRDENGSNTILKIRRASRAGNSIVPLQHSTQDISHLGHRMLF